MKTKVPAYTLIETLIAVTITSLILVTIMGTYWQMIKIENTTNLSRQLQKEVHFALIRMADKIRAYSVNYEAYALDGNCGEVDIDSSHKLCLKGANGTENIFEIAESTIKMNDAPLLSPKFKVENISFSVSPTLDPFSPSNLGTKETQLQPKVSIFLTAVARQNPKIKTTLQTTISSRIYQ